ncbi:hypothetical protein FQN57_003900 [Myotisia sp. PD_48]|nr:hypothetical protein FQN57_003900 [Myotisia sp. PD_48]
MLELTVSQVSGIIAAGIFVLQFFIPTATTLILVGLLTEENNLMSWTQISRALHSSHWPLLVRADFSSIGGFTRSVSSESVVRSAALVVVAIAAIVTPLGLYDEIVPGVASEAQPFGYQKDPSPFGYGTPSRPTLGFNRVCGFLAPVACPGSKTVIVEEGDGRNVTYTFPTGYDIKIPENLTTIYESGLEKFDNTVSSIWDIQWRSYSYETDPKLENGTEYLVAAYRQLDSNALKEGFQLVEGLVIDHDNGGIGFRNHTIPISPLENGGQWSEDLLFVEQHASCVDHNITIDFNLSLNKSFEVENIVLTDRGGFVDLVKKFPGPPNPNRQKDLELNWRAYRAAWLHNANVMSFMNITNEATDDMEAFSYMNSEIDKTFPIDLTTSVDPRFLTTQIDFNIYKALAFSGSRNSSNIKHPYPNPFNVTSKSFMDINTLCQGAAGLDMANITNVGVVCGMVLGAARRSDGILDRDLIFEPGSKWSIPLYSCATAAKAVIKTVDFKFNGTDGFNSLSVTKATNKIYKAESDKPIWAVERPNMAFNDIYPLWGLISELHRNKDGLDAIQGESLWLPGIATRFGMPIGKMNLPGVNFYLHALSTAFSVEGLLSDFNGVGDYSGKTNMAMFAKWQELSRDASKASSIITKIWTDIASNSVLGSRGWIPASRSSLNGNQKRADHAGDNKVEVPVTIFHKRVRYRLLYAIPAAIAVAITAVIGITAVVLAIFGKARPSVMRKYLFHTATGRLLGTFLYPGQAIPQAPTAVWNKNIGSKKVSLANSSPYPTDQVPMVPYKNGASSSVEQYPLIHKDGSRIVHSSTPDPHQQQYPQQQPYSHL